MAKKVDFSNVLEWVDKPVWVVTKIRKKSEKGGRVYQASARPKPEFGIYPGVIREIVIRKGYASREYSDFPQALATVSVFLSGEPNDYNSDMFTVEEAELNAIVFEEKEDAEKEASFLNSTDNTLSYTESRMRKAKLNATMFGVDNM